MAEKVPMTALSPTMEEGTIVSWSKKEGDTVTAGDVLCEVETDKTSVDYESSQEGTLLKIVVGSDGSAAVGQTIAIIGESGEDISEILESVKAESSGNAGSAEEAKKDKKDSDDQKNTGDESKPEKSKEPQPSKAESGSKTDIPKEALAGTPSSKGDSSRIKASPLAVKMAVERNINLALVNGSGPSGRIVKRDIEEFRGVPGGAAAAASTPKGGGAAIPADEEIPVSGRRAVIARRLSESKFTAPHYYLSTSVEMDEVLGARKLLNTESRDKVSLNAFFVKFAAEAIKRHPVINSTWKGDTILQHGSIDIGLAVDAGSGLITPVVRNCGNRGVKEIDADLVDLIQKARDGKLKPEEYTGATFTISNLGSFGVEEFTAIINPPGSAILALGAGKPTPVARQDRSIHVATVMKMTLSCDHRVIDGAAGGRFIHELQSMMEQPARLLF